MSKQGARRLETTMPQTTTIVCPVCSQECGVAVLSDACLFFHECECCGERLRPLAGDCCVICSYSAGACLVKQAEEGSAEAL